MPRLTAEQVKAGILHDHIDARTQALFYFSKSHSLDPTVMPVAIQALERFGRDKAFNYYHGIVDLAQTDETIRWVINELKTQPRVTEEQKLYASHLSHLLAQADPRIIQPHEQEVLSVPAFDAGRREQLTRRVRLLSVDTEALWRRLEAICEEGKEVTYIGDLAWDEAEDIIEVLAQGGERNAERILAGLQMEIGKEEISARTWMRAAMQRLAGEVRYEPAVPYLIADIHLDDELFSEECAKALEKIGTDGVVTAIREAYPTGEWHFRLYAAGVLGEIHSDSAVQTCIDLLKQEEDGELVDWLATSLAEQFSTEGNEVVYGLLEKDDGSWEALDPFLSSCLLTGQDFPRVAEWRRDREKAQREREKFWSRPTKAWVDERPGPAFDPGPAPPPHHPFQHDTAKVGRNDPCPCGSGKKFKKCCMNKAQR